MNKSAEIFYALTVIEPDLPFLGGADSGPDDWDGAARIALKCRLPLIFYRNLKKGNLENKFSSELLGKMRRSWLEAVKNAVFTKEHFSQVARSFSKENVKLMPLKGTSFLTDFYSEEGLRAVSDIDCFILAEDFEKSRGILKNLGYEPRLSLRRGVMMNYGQECEFICPNKPIVDLHYRFFPWHEEKHVFRLDSRAFFERAVLTRRSGLDLWRLGKEDELFYCLLLMVRESRGFSRYFVDADSMARIHQGKLDWDRFRARIEKSPLKSELTARMNFLSEFLKTPFPDFITRFAAETVRGSAFPIFEEEEKNKNRLFSLAKLRSDKWKLLVIYVRWRLFKAFGFFSGFFMERNNPGVKP